MLPALVLIEGPASFGCAVLGKVFLRTLNERPDVALGANRARSDIAISAAVRHRRVSTGSLIRVKTCTHDVCVGDFP